MIFLGKKQLFKLLWNEPLFVLQMVYKLLKYPSSLYYLFKGNSENLPLEFYSIGGQLVLKYNTLEFKDNFMNKLNEKLIKNVLEKDYGSHNFQRALVKWNGTLYSICRITKPEIIVETGVFWGFSSAHVLKALKDNDNGVLYSIDITPSKLESIGVSSGVVVPNELKNRWNLIFGESKNVLPALLKKLNNIDIFIHDSEHSYKNMIFEYKTSWPYIRKGGLLISHDVDPSGSPFIDFVKSVGATYYIKDAIGIAIKK